MVEDTIKKIHLIQIRPVYIPRYTEKGINLISYITKDHKKTQIKGNVC